MKRDIYPIPGRRCDVKDGRIYNGLIDMYRDNAHEVRTDGTKVAVMLPPGKTLFKAQT